MKTNKQELRLTDITRYDDVEDGTLVLTVGERTKRWKAIWLTDLRLGSSRNLPRGDLALRYRNYREWIDCPRIRLNHQNFMWIEPLRAANWYDMGVNLYLCTDEGWPHPLPRQDYELMIRVLTECHIKMLTVEPPRHIVDGCRFGQDEQTGMAGFWED